MGNDIVIFESERGPCGYLRILTIVVAGFIALATGFAPARATQFDGAIAVAEKVHALTVAADGSRSRLAAVIEKYLDMADIARKVSGKAWDGAGEAERRDFQTVLRDVMATELDRRIRADDRLRVNEAKALSGGAVVVLTTQIRRDGSGRRLDWKMRPCGGSYCLYDLVGNGASLTAARRDDYAARLRALGGSLAALTQSLREELDARK